MHSLFGFKFHWSSLLGFDLTHYRNNWGIKHYLMGKWVGVFPRIALHDLLWIKPKICYKNLSCQQTARASKIHVTRAQFLDLSWFWRNQINILTIFNDVHKNNLKSNYRVMRATLLHNRIKLDWEAFKDFLCTEKVLFVTFNWIGFGWVTFSFNVARSTVNAFAYNRQWIESFGAAAVSSRPCLIYSSRLSSSIVMSTIIRKSQIRIRGENEKWSACVQRRQVQLSCFIGSFRGWRLLLKVCWSIRDI